MTLTDLINETDYAAQRGVSLRTVQRERAQRIGPPFIKLGRVIYYRPAASNLGCWRRNRRSPVPRGGPRDGVVP